MTQFFQHTSADTEPLTEHTTDTAQDGLENVGTPGCLVSSIGILLHFAGSFLNAAGVRGSGSSPFPGLLVQFVPYVGVPQVWDTNIPRRAQRLQGVGKAFQTGYIFVFELATGLRYLAYPLRDGGRDTGVARSVQRGQSLCQCFQLIRVEVAQGTVHLFQLTLYGVQSPQTLRSGTQLRKTVRQSVQLLYALATFRRDLKLKTLKFNRHRSRPLLSSVFPETVC